MKISLTDIRHSMLDQCLDQTETDVEEEQGKDYLNPKPVLAPGMLSIVDFLNHLTLRRDIIKGNKNYTLV